eukprot:TRINITY_DN2018_c0_g1_i3.p1 TRINITY_DN2018_c0_g1~~TRINITY_DN2018_c0_g1_i3.p1  ORF type:complete len:208 (-),score=23.51 TRINITY_DN2018_c0_g1_i3:70-693(-)
MHPSCISFILKNESKVVQQKIKKKERFSQREKGRRGWKNGDINAMEWMNDCICNDIGKTTTLYKLLLGEVVLTKPTIGSNVEEIVHENIRFQMWDIGGQASLRKSWDTYYSGAKAIILVIDSTDQEYISVAKTELDAMLDHEDLRNSVLLVFANKQDLKDSMEPADISEHLDLDSIKDHDWHIQGCCALTGEGLTEGLDWISSKVNT